MIIILRYFCFRLCDVRWKPKNEKVVEGDVRGFILNTKIHGEVRANHTHLL